MSISKHHKSKENMSHIEQMPETIISRLVNEDSGDFSCFLDDLPLKERDFITEKIESMINTNPSILKNSSLN